jgi:hypothetical protein
MPMETMKFENGPRTYRIQFEIVAPGPAAIQKPSITKNYGPKPQHTVASIRITEITESVGDDGEKKVVNFARGFDTLAQARTGAGEYAKRIVREKMTPRPAAAVEAPAETPPAAPETPKATGT